MNIRCLDVQMMKMRTTDRITFKLGLLLGIASTAISLVLFREVFGQKQWPPIVKTRITKIWRKAVLNEFNNVSPSKSTKTYSSDSDTDVYKMSTSNELELQKRRSLSWSTSNSSFNECPPRIEMSDIVRDDIPKELYEVAPEVFDHMPKEFERGLRSPCWKSRGRLSCLPSFLLAGVGKCGTTDVWSKIVAHPHIIASVKEARWWTRKRVGRDKALYHPFPLKWYTRQFDKLAKEITKSKSTKARKLITGDGSPAVFWDNVVWKNTLTDPCRNLTTPRYVVADVIRTVLPKIKILAVFRNPTSRLYSDYMFDNRSCTPEFFHESVTQSTKTFESCLVKMTRRECVFKFFSEIYEQDMARDPPKGKLGMNPLMRLFKGSYSVFVADWLRAFPREQVMFIKLEDWHGSCETILPNIYQFLELEPLSKEETDAICSLKQQNPTHGKKSKGPMLDTTKQLLDQFYEPIRKDLAELLGDNRFLWD